MTSGYSDMNISKPPYMTYAENEEQNNCELSRVHKTSINKYKLARGQVNETDYNVKEYNCAGVMLPYLPKKEFISMRSSSQVHKMLKS